MVYNTEKLHYGDQYNQGSKGTEIRWIDECGKNREEFFESTGETPPGNFWIWGNIRQILTDNIKIKLIARVLKTSEVEEETKIYLF